MRQTPSRWLRCVRGIQFMVALAALSLSACYESESITCSSGLVCPARLKCSADGKSCLIDPCGDGIQQETEACDDGDKVDGDGCSADCNSTEQCGNDVIDRSVGEVCDDGNIISGDGCSADCKSNETCGNRIVDLAVGEVCDNGDKENGGGCSADCKSNETCGNGVKDEAAGEVCDDGNTQNGDGCGSDCHSTGICHNKVVDVGEECDDDDNNPDNTDGCVDECKRARCGDGYWNRASGSTEECDDKGESATCNYNCTVAKCGDGIVNAKAGEQCDENNLPSATCTPECKVSFCGDGYVNRVAGEDCDYGNSAGKGKCPMNCRLTGCGDGRVDVKAGEDCDDGNRDDCGTCNATCTQSQDLKQASGTIEVVDVGSQAGKLIEDRWKFAISDGYNLPEVFEFEKYDGVSDGNKRIDITDDMDSAEVADKIYVAIGELTHLKFTRGYDNPHKIRLTNNVMGALGNQLIVCTEKDIYDILKLSGMSGGAARDCPRDTGCMSDNDCAFDLKCKENPTNPQSKTCQP